MNELRTAPSAVLRNSARGISMACTFTPSAFSATLDAPTRESSMVTSTRSMSDRAHTVSCDMLPARITARTDRSCPELGDKRVERAGEVGGDSQG